MKKLNARGFTHSIVMAAFVAIFAIAGVGYLVASHADSVCSSSSSQTVNGVAQPATSSSSCNSSNCSTTTTVNGQTTTSTSCPTVPSVSIPKITIPKINIPTPTVPKTVTPTPVASAPAPPPNINHPTAASCLPTGKQFTVYASVAAGTPAYNYSGTTVLRLVPYKTAITNVYCNDKGTLIYHYDGLGSYSTYHLQDVSLTQP
jgi:cytoskeletal protein RodZ